MSGTLIRWLRACGFYLIHAVIAGIAVFLVTTFLGAGVGRLDTKVADVLFGGPIFLPYIVVGAVTGFFINGAVRSKSAKWAWMIPFLPILYDFHSFENLGWKFTFTYLFGPKQGAGIEQLFTIAPFYGAVAYSVGAWAALRRKAIREKVGEKSGTARVLLMVALYSLIVVIGVYVFTFVFVLSTILISHSVGRLARIAFGRPYYGGEVAIALVGGLLLGARIRPYCAKWVWVLPSIWLAGYMAYSVHLAGQMNIAQYLWMHFFTGRCAANPYVGCPEETFGSCPFFSSVAYSFGAWVMSRFGMSHVNLESKPTPSV